MLLVVQPKFPILIVPIKPDVILAFHDSKKLLCKKRITSSPGIDEVNKWPDDVKLLRVVSAVECMTD